MTLLVLLQDFTVCQVASLEGIDFSRPYVFLSKTEDELSLVCEPDCVPETATAVDEGWRAFRIVGPLDFGMIGVIAGISDVLAKRRISLFVISTYNTDYVLVKNAAFLRAVQALQEEGYKVEY